MTFQKALFKTNSKLSWIHYFSIYVWIGWLHFYIVLFFTLPFIYTYAKTLFSVLAAIIISSIILPINRNIQPKICYEFGSWLIAKATEYFQVEVMFEDIKEVQKHSPAIFALEPHDVLPISLSFFQPQGTIPGHKCAGLVTSICFSIPIMRHIYTWCNAYSVDKANMINLIENGISPVLCPGGVQEVSYLDTNKKEYVLYLKNRLGFIKLAYRFGIPIIPVFSFGLQSSFDLWNIKNKFLNNIGRRIGFAPVIFFGMWGTIMGPPKACKYINVIGKPILITKNANPTEAELRNVSNKYIDETIRLFETYKSQYNMANYTLRVV